MANSDRVKGQELVIRHSVSDAWGAVTSQPPRGFRPCHCDLLHLRSTMRGWSSYEARQSAAEDKNHLGKHPLQTLNGWTLISENHPPTKHLQESWGHLTATCYQRPNLSLQTASICHVKITSAWNGTSVLNLCLRQILRPNIRQRPGVRSQVGQPSFQTRSVCLFMVLYDKNSLNSVSKHI